MIKPSFFLTFLRTAVEQITLLYILLFDISVGNMLDFFANWKNSWGNGSSAGMSWLSFDILTRKVEDSILCSVVLFRKNFLKENNSKLWVHIPWNCTPVRHNLIELGFGQNNGSWYLSGYIEKLSWIINSHTMTFQSRWP